MPEGPMNVAMLAITFPQAAQKTSLLMGLWKALFDKNVVIMNVAPSRESTEHTRSVVSITVD
jgi:hypothetical protein